jgi:endoglucanase
MARYQNIWYFFQSATVAIFCAIVGTACSVKRESARAEREAAPESHSVMTELESTNIPYPVPSETGIEVFAEQEVVRPAGFSRLRADGPLIVDDQGNAVTLRGCNLGNWLLLEMWMLDVHNVRDQQEFISILRQRFGGMQTDRLLNAYRLNWITARDFQLLKEFGFNAVRLPFHYGLLERDDKPFQLREDAFRWLDHAVQLASNAGVYVILDMHGAPGGQSADHTTGHAGENRLWKDESCRERFVWLWREIARRYADNPVVAAYDLLNEPFGVESEAQHKLLVELMAKTVNAIRSEGDSHVIFLPATRSGFAFYGPPAERGWANVGFTDHFYPGLFGSEPTKENHAQFVYRQLPAVSVIQRELNAPFLVGEFNVVYDKVGGAPLMRYYYDLYEGYGWSAMMWSYKLVKIMGTMRKDSWAIVVNRDPAPAFDVRSSTLEDIENYMGWLGKMAYAVNTRLRSALASENPPPVELPPLEHAMVTPPANDDISPWQATDIGQALPGGQKKLSEDAFDVYGGGADIWAKRDQFRFIWKKADGDFQIRAQAVSLSNTHVYAKAGLMIRSSLSPDSAHVLIHVFPDGQTAIAWREAPGELTRQKLLPNVSLPASLSMARRGAYLDVAIAGRAGHGTNVTVRLSELLRGPVHVGFAVLSHDHVTLTTAGFRDISFATGTR